jgi:hypothetical protein
MIVFTFLLEGVPGTASGCAFGIGYVFHRRRRSDPNGASMPCRRCRGAGDDDFPVFVARVTIAAFFPSAIPSTARLS